MHEFVVPRSMPMVLPSDDAPSKMGMNIRPKLLLATPIHLQEGSSRAFGPFLNAQVVVWQSLYACKCSRSPAVSGTLWGWSLPRWRQGQAAAAGRLPPVHVLRLAVCGVGLILAASDGRARLAASIYAAAIVGPARHERAVPGRRDLASGPRRWMKRLDQLDDLRARYRHVHTRALLALKGSLAARCCSRAVGGRARRGDLQARLDRHAEVGCYRDRVRLARPRHRRGLRELPTAIGWLSPRACARRSHCTLPAR